LTKNPQNQNN